MNNVTNAARQWAFSKDNPPAVLLEISEQKALELCDRFPDIDREMVHVGVLLMDIMLTEALAQHKLGEHVAMSAGAVTDFLIKYGLSEDRRQKIINCVEAHHKGVPFRSLEAEICANADCYRFIHPRGFFFYLTHLGERGMMFPECLDQAERKLDEKMNILSLQYCKDELTPYYSSLKKFISDARDFSHTS